MMRRNILNGYIQLLHILHTNHARLVRMELKMNERRNTEGTWFQLVLNVIVAYEN